MLRFVEKLQGKPEPARRRIAFLCALISVGVIAVVWVTTLSSKINEEKSLSSSITPLQSLFQSTKRALGDTITRVRGEGEYERE